MGTSAIAVDNSPSSPHFDFDGLKRLDASLTMTSSSGAKANDDRSIGLETYISSTERLSYVGSKIPGITTFSDSQLWLRHM